MMDIEVYTIVSRWSYLHLTKKDNFLCELKIINLYREFFVKGTLTPLSLVSLSSLLTSFLVTGLIRSFGLSTESRLLGFVQDVTYKIHTRPC